MQVFGRRLLWAIFAVRLAAQPAWGPDEIRSTHHPYELPSPGVLKVRTDLVQVNVVVRDSHGRALDGLGRDDFAVYDEGKKREITAFSVETTPAPAPPDGANVSAAAPVAPAKSVATPRFVVLYFDDYSITSGDLTRTKIAAERLVKEALSPGDRVAIFTTSAQTLEFTGDKARLIAAIEKLSAHPRVNPDGIEPCPRITPYQAYEIFINDPIALDAAAKEAYVCMYGPPAPSKLNESEQGMLGSSVRAQADATWEQAKQVSQQTLAAILNAVDGLAQMPGTRVLVLASAGFLTHSLELEQDQIIDRAVRGGVVINALDAKGLYTDDTHRQAAMVHGGDLPPSTYIFEQTTAGSRGMDANAVMADLAASTGGWFFQNRNDLESGFQLGLRPETTYLLGFSASGVPADGKFHRLRVRLSHQGSDHIAARPGYFAPSAAAESSSPAPRKIDAEAAATDVVSEVPARFVAETKQGDAHELAVTLIVEVGQLKFERKDDRRMQKLSFVAALFDGDGNFVTGQEGQVDFALKDATYQRFAQNGISTQVLLPAAPGAYRLRAVVQQESDGKLTAANDQVEIH
ncbi:MAG TPA: VWA domain-containing protein [Bryobacteraceae bacterium]|nr:VWA domain-containing protein [Bryobacteraceae bacterium]